MTARKYTDKPVDKWTVNDFLAYVADRHLELYGVEYRPFRSWQAERGLIGGIIGTRGKNAKPRKHEPAVLKAFIDECFASHRVSAQYPGVSFGWFWTYKSAIWQRIIAEESRKEQRQQAETTASQTWDDLADWL
ncbi:hypothetical protein HYI36_20295 [Bacillus sp. Gen3]|nr:hypothetical protein [Bacillus sp. Gen3]